MQKYPSSTAGGLIRNAQVCGKVIKELERVNQKFLRAASREKEKRRAELETVLGYTLADIEDLYDYASISRKRFDRYRRLLEEGQDALDDPTPTLDELASQIVNGLIRDLSQEQHESELAALPPEARAAELAKAEAARLAWSEKIAAIKERRGHI